MKQAKTRVCARDKLAAFKERVVFQHLAALKHALDETIVFSNELLDALPVHRVTKHEGELSELGVALSENEQFVWTKMQLTTPRLAAYLARARTELRDRQIADINLAAEDWLRGAAAALESGFIITVDYGAQAAELYDFSLHPYGTLRAFWRHQFINDVPARPGEHDLTTTVDWTQIETVGEECGLRRRVFARQDEFLLRAGLLDELLRLTTNAQSEAVASALRTSEREMILPGSMSSSFQVLVQGKARQNKSQ
jgi:SAM-dependent MidA family methyltransferase